MAAMTNPEHQSSTDSEVIATYCNYSECPSRASCARFHDPYRAEQKGLPDTVLVIEYHPLTDNCFVLRKQLQGTMDNQRYYSRTTKNHRRKKGEWA